MSEGSAIFNFILLANSLENYFAKICILNDSIGVRLSENHYFLLWDLSFYRNLSFSPGTLSWYTRHCDLHLSNQAESLKQQMSECWNQWKQINPKNSWNWSPLGIAPKAQTVCNLCNRPSSSCQDNRDKYVRWRHYCICHQRCNSPETNHRWPKQLMLSQ